MRIYTLVYERPNGAWRGGWFAYTLPEARAAARRDKDAGLRVRVVPLLGPAAS